MSSPTYEERIHARAVHLHDIECGDRTCEPQAMGKWFTIAQAEANEKDRIALETIHRILDGKEWNSDTMSLVADQVRITGRIVRDVE